MEEVVLVNEEGKVLGTMEKLKAHKRGVLHKAFSILVFNNKNQLLIQQRAKEKYHSGSLWSNTCCSHQRSKESLIEVAQKRLKQEMGFICNLKESFSFVYRIKLNNGLTEHEYDTVLIGNYSRDPKPNPEEVMNYKWMDLNQLRKDIAINPSRYTPWLKIILNKLAEQDGN